MKTDRRTEIKVGLISLTAIIILVITLLLGNQVSFFKKSNQVQITFPNAAGLKVGEPIMLRGVKIGKVESIAVNSKSVLVGVELDDISLLHEDLGATITMLEMTGGRKIDLHPGKSEKMFNPKDTIIGSPPQDLGSIIGTIVGMQDDIIGLFGGINEAVDNLNSMFADSSLIDGLNRTVSKAEGTLDNVNGLVNRNVEDLSIIADNLRSISGNINEMLSENKSDLSGLISSLGTLTANIDKMAGSMTNLPSDITEIVSELKTFTKKLDDNSSAFGLLFNDPAFAKKLESTVEHIDSLVVDIEENGIETRIRFGKK